MSTPVTIYFDGHCPLCSREIAHYRTLVGDEPVSFVDIAADDFDGLAHGVRLEQARRLLHVKVGPDVRTGIDAVIAMWQAIPRYRWLARFASLPGIHLLAGLCYRVFAAFRPYWQHRAGHECETGTCAH